MKKQEQIRKARAFKSMLIFGMFSIVMFFAGLTSAYIVSKGALSAEGKWDLITMPISFRFSTIAIFLSSFAAAISFSNLKRNHLESASRYLIFSLVFALVFSFFQIKGWSHLVNEGHFFAGKDSNIASSFIYVLTGAHFTHVIAGLIVLLVLITRLRLKKYTQQKYLGFKLGLWFWHFLGILWIYLYGFLLYSTSI